MSDEQYPRPGDYKTHSDGRGGLIRAVLVGGPHAGRELFRDELDLPAELWTTASTPFQWWPADLHEHMATLPIGNDPEAPPAHYRLEIADGAEPRYLLVEG